MDSKASAMETEWYSRDFEYQSIVDSMADEVVKAVNNPAYTVVLTKDGAIRMFDCNPTDKYDCESSSIAKELNKSRNFVDFLLSGEIGIGLQKDGSVVAWALSKGILPLPEEVSNIADICFMGGAVKHAVALNRSGQIVAWHVYSGKIDKSLLPEFAGKAVALRGRGQAAAVQLEDGSWQAWGKDTELIDEINSLSPAVDIAFFHGRGTYYLYWIEPVLHTLNRSQ